MTERSNVLILVDTSETRESLAERLREAEAFRETIFEKFGQVEARGQGTKRSTGLGLTFCRLAIEAHGGTIGVECPEEAGSCFWFEIPRQAGRAATSGRPASP